MSSILDALRKLEAAKKASKRRLNLSPFLLEERAKSAQAKAGPTKEVAMSMKGLPIGLLMAFLALVAGLFFGLGYLTKGEDKTVETASIVPSPSISSAPQPSAPVVSKAKEKLRFVPTKHVVKIHLPFESPLPKIEKPQPPQVKPEPSAPQEGSSLNAPLSTIEPKKAFTAKEVEVKAPLVVGPHESLDADLLGSTLPSSSQGPILEGDVKEEDLELLNFLSPDDAPFPDLKINAISWEGDTAGAIVNMKKVYEGDKIAGAKVIKINLDSIFFEYQGRLVKVRF